MKGLCYGCWIMARKRPSIADLLQLDDRIDVVDIGANPIDGEPPYNELLQAGLARVTGFEPNPEALARLNAAKGEHETYLPDAVYDGGEHELKVCQSQGMTSLLEPNQNLLRYFHGFPKWGMVTERRPVQTVRLDDVAEITNIDFLKIDIQGAELEVFKNATKRLSDCLVVHTEVEFLPLYEGQPLFSEVEMFLRDMGFVFHRFEPLTSRTIQPMLVNNDIYKGLSQITWADAVFIRDFTRFDDLDPGDLKKMALILNDIYGSIDIVLRALMTYDGKTRSKLVEQFTASL